MKTYIGNNNIAYETNKVYTGINNIAKEIKKIYVGVNGIAQQVYGDILPIEYQRIEYLQSNGTQYIDTGVIHNTGTTAIVDFEFISGVQKLEQRALSEYESSSVRFQCGMTSGAFTTTHGFTVNQTNVWQRTIGTGTGIGQGSYSCYLFAQNGSGSPAHVRGSTRIYSCQISQDGILIRDFIPCFRKNDMEFGMFDMVNKIFYQNIGTGKFFGPIPNYYNRYQPVEYIQGDNASWIDTGIQCNGCSSIEIDVIYQDTISTAAWRSIIGAATGQVSGTWSWNPQLHLAVNGSNNIVTEIPSSSSASASLDSGIAGGTSKHTIKLKISSGSALFNVDGKEVTGTSSAPTYSPDTTLTLFTRNYTSEGDYTKSSYASAIKIFNCSIKIDNVLVRNFIPCYSKKDSTIGMYDLIENKFYINSGTGTFIKGADI